MNIKIENDGPIINIQFFCWGNHFFKGAGGGGLRPGEGHFEFPVVSDREECQLPDAFYWIKNIVPSLSYQILKSGKYG